MVILVAALTFVAWLVRGPSPAFSYALINAVAVTDHRVPVCSTAATAILVSIDGKLAGFVAIADPIQATTPQAFRH